MAQQFTHIEAVKTQDVDRAYFLSHTSKRGTHWNHAPMGHHAVDFSVLVFGPHNSIEGFPVVLSVKHGAFSLQDYLTPAEARTYARALLLAADHADQQQQAQADALQAATEAAEVAA